MNDPRQRRQHLPERWQRQHGDALRRKSRERVLQQRHDGIRSSAENYLEWRLLSKVRMRTVQPDTGFAPIARASRHQRQTPLDRPQPGLQARSVWRFVHRGIAGPNGRRDLRQRAALRFS
jgi:hypothetical protein